MKPVRFPWLAGRAAALVLALASVLPLGACMSPVSEEDTHFEGARVTGAYPNLNIRPEAAATRYSRAEASSDRAGLTALRETVEEEGETKHESQQERLRELGATHGQRAIEEIEETRAD